MILLSYLFYELILPLINLTRYTYYQATLIHLFKLMMAVQTSETTDWNEHAIYKNIKCGVCIYFESALLINLLEFNYLQEFMNFIEFYEFL